MIIREPLKPFWDVRFFNGSYEICLSLLSSIFAHGLTQTSRWTKKSVIEVLYNCRHFTITKSWARSFWPTLKRTFLSLVWVFQVLVDHNSRGWVFVKDVEGITSISLPTDHVSTRKFPSKTAYRTLNIWNTLVRNRGNSKTSTKKRFTDILLFSPLRLACIWGVRQAFAIIVNCLDL